MIDPLFQVHRLNEGGLKNAQLIGEAFNDLLKRLQFICPNSTREFAITKTKLEEAAFFAKKSMANDITNQEN